MLSYRLAYRLAYRSLTPAIGALCGLGQCLALYASTESATTPLLARRTASASNVHRRKSRALQQFACGFGEHITPNRLAVAVGDVPLIVHHESIDHPKSTRHLICRPFEPPPRQALVRDGSVIVVTTARGAGGGSRTSRMNPQQQRQRAPTPLLQEKPFPSDVLEEIKSYPGNE